MKNLKFRTLIITLVVFMGVFIFPIAVSAQGFGSNPDNYYCPTYSGITGDYNTDTFKCTYTDAEGNTFTRNALIKPPPLTILQVWFVRFLYVIWAVSGVIFTFILMGIGAKYMMSFGNEIALGEVIKSFQKWVVGLVLIFLSYPILTTFFNLLPISQNTCYSDIEMPGFQFFFPNACIDEGAKSACLNLGFVQGSSDYGDCVGYGSSPQAVCIGLGNAEGTSAYNSCVRRARGG